MPDVEEDTTVEIRSCENCGRDSADAEKGPDGVVWCPECRPEY